LKKGINCPSPLFYVDVVCSALSFLIITVKRRGKRKRRRKKRRRRRKRRKRRRKRR